MIEFAAQIVLGAQFLANRGSGAFREVYKAEIMALIEDHVAPRRFSFLPDPSYCIAGGVQRFAKRLGNPATHAIQSIGDEYLDV